MKQVLFVFVAILLLFSCGDSEDIAFKTLTKEEVSAILKVDEMSTSVDDILDQDEFDEDFSFRNHQSSIANCVVRTVEDSDNQRMVTLDFGEGCSPNNYREFSGIIQIVYTRTDNSLRKEVSFRDFFVNGNQIIGSRSVERIRSNSNGNPQSTSVEDITVNFSNGDSSSRTGTKIREKIEGNDTGTRGDDVISITGNWQTTNREGITKGAEVISPLIRKFACRYFVSGVVELTRGDASATIDFGNGECDNLATVTGPGGNTFQIEL